MNLRRLGVTAVAVVGIAVAAMAAADSSDSNPQFDQYCIACHGADGRGISGLGLDLVASKFVAGKSEADMVEFLKVGRLPDDPASLTGRPMPGFSWVTDSELKSIAAFLRAQNGKGAS